ncbi:MAG TPA: hypothetical protein VK524_04735 [Polyangiaceae bacterium]|nr:hypothetical protein [Polyangiaceae bacterium]
MRWAHALASPRLRVLAVALGTALALTSVGPRLALDDYVLGLAARGQPDVPGFVQDQFDLFTFTTGQKADNRALIEQGFLLPWWTEPELKIAFFRPLTSLTHRLDFSLWPDSPRSMYAQSLGWFALVLALVALLYRELELSPKIAGLALLLYALDDAHGAALSWLSNRNALLATLFGVLTIILHHRWRKSARPALGVLAAACLALGLLAGEFALGALAYLLGYALFIDDEKLPRRLLSLWPYGVVLVCWRIAYQHFGFGARGSGAYVDPSSDPFTFLSILPAKLAVLYTGALAGPPADSAFFGPAAQRPLLVLWAACVCATAALLFWPLLRRDRRARFWACGAILAAIPVSASFPSDRLLFFVGLGMMALLARLFCQTLEQWGEGRLAAVRRAVVLGFATLHLLAAPLLLPVRAAQMQLLGGLLDRVDASIPRSAEVERQSVVLLDAPIDIFASYIQPARAWKGSARPSHLYWLASASSAIEVRRPSANALRLRPSQGFLFAPLEQHYRGALQSLPVGKEVALSRMTARVIAATADGRPQEVEFTFREPLESRAYVFLRWDRGGYVPFTLPQGGQVTLPARDFGQILLEHALSR